MSKIYNAITVKNQINSIFSLRTVFLTVFVMALFSVKTQAQVTVSASAGIPAGSYTTVKGAFDAINRGDHQGDIIVNINASTNEGTTPATLNSQDADPASYTSILIRPTANNIVVTGNPASGFGVIQLKGSDNITINGDNPNTGGQNRNLTINNTSATANVANSCIRIATSSAVFDADNISIVNCILNGNVIGGNSNLITTLAGSGGTSFGIYVGGNGGNSETDAPTAITNVTTNPAPFGTTVKSLIIQNNQITQCARAIAFNGADASVSNSLTISDNVIGTSGSLSAFPYTTPATTVYTNGIWVAGTEGVEINNNTFYNIISYVSTSISAIELNTAIGSGTINITNNNINGVANNLASAVAAGININNLGGPITISGNNINTIHNTAGSSTNPAVGIRINTTGGVANILSNKISGILNFNFGGWPAYGIHLASAANGALIENNFISNVMNIGNTSFGNTVGAEGIYLGSGNNHRVYHNSIHLYGTSQATSSNSIACIGINANTQTGLDIRNNVLANLVDGGTASDVHVCIFMPFTLSSSMNLTLNNNAYYTGGVAGLNGIAYLGNSTYNAANLFDVSNFTPLLTTGATNWRNKSFQMGNTSNDLYSFGSLPAPPFTSNTDLHIPAGTPTGIEGGGTPLSTSNDIDGAGRNAVTPDIGADEFSGTLSDYVPPTIVFDTLISTCTVGSRNLDVTITDASGVPTSGAGLPTLYWKINAGAYNVETATHLGGSNYRFTFGAGAILGDVVSYYIAAQDNSANQNTITSPAIGSDNFTANPPAAATDPTTVYTYTIQSLLATGTYTIGAAGNYTSIAAAITAYNTSCLNGPITFTLLDASNGLSSELVIYNPQASAINTLTIKPNTGVAAVITGAGGTSMFKLLGADYVTFDGLNTGGSSLTFNANSANSTSIWIASNRTKGATNITIQNCGFTHQSSSTTMLACIVSGTGTGVGTSDLGIPATAPNNNISIIGNTFRYAKQGVLQYGSSLSFDQNWTISGNTIGTTAANLSLRGVVLQNINNFTVSNNTFSGIVRAASTAAAGIAIFQTTTNGTITRNSFNNIRNSSTAGGSYGILLNNINNSSNVTVSNNMIWDIFAQGSSTITSNANGIVMNTGGGYKIFYNSIHLATNPVNTSAITAPIRIANTLTLSGALDIRNNIFSNSITLGIRYCIYNQSSPGIFNDINYNNYYKGTSPFLGFISGSGRTTLQAWQTVTGKDLQSITIDPLFVSATNLHLNPLSPMNALAQAGTGVSNDFDNDARTVNTDIGADEFDATDCSGTPTGGTIATPFTTFCVSGIAYFTATGFTTGDGLQYQWQSSTDNFGSVVNNLSGQTIPSNAVSGSLIQNTQFRLRATCTISGQVGYSNVINITVNSPLVSTTTPGTRCGLGTVNLGATTSTGGATLNWYDVPVGGLALGTGTSFTTPVINNTTTFYVEAATGATAGTVGPLSPQLVGSTSISTFAAAMNFNVIQNTTIQSVDIYPQTLGSTNGTIEIRNSAGVLQGSAVNFTTTAAGGTVPQTITLNIVLTPGSYAIRFGTVPTGGAMRNFSGGSYPYTSNAVNITGNSAGSLSSYYYFYNWQFLSSCPSIRTAVVATVTPPPAVNAVATPAVICSGESTNLSATSSNSGYTYVWNPGALPGASVSASPASNTTYVVVATDNSGGANNGCATSDTLSVSVRPKPNTVSVSPASSVVCIGGPATLLNATGGSLNNVIALSENFNGATNNWTTFNNSTGANASAIAWTLRPNAYTYNTSNTFTSNDNSQFYLSNGDAGGGGSITATILQSPVIDLSTYSTASLSFWHHFRASPGVANVEISTDGSNWTVINSYTTNQGTLSGFVQATFDISSYAGQPIVYIRFKYDGSFPWWWALDNVTISGNVNTSMSWTQAPAAPNAMFTDAAGSVPYIAGTPLTSIYVKPTVNTVFTATSTGPAPSNCTNSGTTSFTVTPAVAVSIVESTNNVCSGTSVTFTATPVSGGPSPTYQWQVNGGNQGTNSATFTYAPSNADIVTVIMTGNGTCTFGNPATSNAITMNILPPVSVGVTITANPGNIICTGNSVTFTAVPLNGGAGPIYQWKKNGINVGINSDTYTDAALVNADVITCVITSNAQCISGSASATSNQIVMTVNNTGAASVAIGIGGPSTTVCSGIPITVTATPTNGGTAPNYEFKVNTITVQNGLLNNYTYTPTNGDVIQVTMTSNYTCLGANPAIVNSNTLNMTVVANAPVSVNLTASATQCSGQPLVITANPTNGGASPNYEFIFNGSTIQNGPLNTYTILSPVNGNTMQVILTSSFTCATGSPATSSLYTVALNASPSVSAISADCNNILPGSGQQATITVTATPGSGTIDTYQWKLNGVTNVGANLPTYSTNVAGSYTVEITNSNGCITTSSAVVITANGVALTGGSYIIPATGCSGFDKISSAVSYLNTWGVAGAVTFNIAPGYTETAPVGGYALTATGTSTNTIVFQRDGAGVKPVITAGAHVAGTNNDGIFKIIGGDYITLRNLDFREDLVNNTNTTPGGSNDMTEWAVALLYATTTNGPNNNLIENCDISLNRLYSNSFGIYSNLRHAAGTPNTGSDITNTTGGNNKVYGCAISNVNIPVYLLSAGTAMSPGNDIGGSSSATGNIISNWGSNTSPSTGTLFYNTVVQTNLEAIYLGNQTGVNASWNTITSASNNLGMSASVAYRGIHSDFIGTAPSGTFTNTITNNSIILSNANSNGTPTSFEGIAFDNSAAAAPVSGVTLNMNNNSVQSTISGAGANYPIVGIRNAFPAGTVSMSDNIFKGNTSTANGGGFTGISNTAAVLNTLNISNNNFGDGSTNTVTFSVATSGAVSAISLATNATAATTTVNINNNSFTKFVHNALGTSQHNYITITGATNPPVNLNINTNTFINLVTNSNGVMNCINNPAIGTFLSANKSISGNTFTNITGGTGAMTMISSNGASVSADFSNNNIGNNVAASIVGSGNVTGMSLLNTASGIATVSNNTVTGIQSGGTNIYGILSLVPTATVTGNNINTITGTASNSAIFGLTLSGTTVNASLNIIHTLTGTFVGLAGASATGVNIAGGTTVNLFRNRIYNLSENAATGNPIITGNPIVNGIVVAGGTNVTVHNNFVSDLKAPQANLNDAIRGISITSSIASSSCNIYYNSVYLNASSAGANFGTSAIFHTGSATATTAVLNLRNNIISNESSSNGSGYTVALRKANVNLNNYGVASNNNMFFAGSVATPGRLFFDGTNFETTLAGLQTRLSTRETLSIYGQPSFVSATDLHLLANNNCGIDGAAAPIAGITIDLDNDTRDATTPDIGADEFVGTGGGPGVWKGLTTNWNDPQNWCGTVPSLSTNVTIPNGVPNYPLITAAGPVSKNISIAAGASVTITGTGKLGIAGTISNSGTFDVSDGTIEMIGTVAQTIPATAFASNNIKNLIISNTAAAPGVSLGGALNLTGKLSFTGNNKVFTTGGFLTLKSNATTTASVGDITSNNVGNNNNQILGDVTVERYISEKRAWRLLSSPTQHNLQNIHEAWQENQTANSNTPAGFGIKIYSNIAGWAAAGFDLQTPAGPSMKTYNQVTNDWVGAPSTLVPFTAGEGYMTFTRGDRTTNTSGPGSAPFATVIREKGALNTYNKVSNPIGAGLFGVVGNPYASAVDFTKLTKTNLQDVYYLWDPQLGTYGGYVTFTGPGYTAVPASPSYSGGNKFIESGQAFFVRSSGSAGSVTFTEQSKADGSFLVSRDQNTGKVFTNIYSLNTGTPAMLDGVLVEFDQEYTDGVNQDDAAKLVNFGENLGMLRYEKNLSVERRPEVVETDTVFLNLNQVKVQSYRFEFKAEHMETGMMGYLEDLYLGTQTPVNMEGTTLVDFTIENNPLSYASDRFRLVFRQLGPVPVTFTTVRANRQEKNILVDWKVSNEVNIHHYEVEKSANGRNFAKVGSQTAIGNGNGMSAYSWLDTNPFSEDNFYRIRSVGNAGEIKFSQIVKVNIGKQQPLITVYPNPISEDGVINVSLSNQPAGNYQVRLLNTAGQVVMKKAIVHPGGNSNYPIRMDKFVAHGTYMLSVHDEKEVNFSLKIVY